MKIRELARELGVSIGTVSRALNNRPDVSPDTRLRIREAAERFGYVANQSGRSLRQGVTNTIGFMMEVGPETSTESHRFFSLFLDGVQSVLQRHDLDLVVLACRSAQDREAYLRRVVSRGVVDGLILSATHTIDPRLAFLEAYGAMAFTALGRSDSILTNPWVDLDFEGFMANAVGRLVGFGHRRIAFATTESPVNLVRVEKAAFRHEMETRGLRADLVLDGEVSEAGGYAAGRRIAAMPDRPTAVILQHDCMASGFYGAMAEAGLDVGRDISVIGPFLEDQMRFLSPRLTSFHIDHQGLGRETAEALLASMPAYAAVYPRGITRRLWPMELVPGGSDGPAPA